MSYEEFSVADCAAGKGTSTKVPMYDYKTCTDHAANTKYASKVVSTEGKYVKCDAVVAADEITAVKAVAAAKKL